MTETLTQSLKGLSHPQQQQQQAGMPLEKTVKSQNKDHLSRLLNELFDTEKAYLVDLEVLHNVPFFPFVFTRPFSQK